MTSIESKTFSRDDRIYLLSPYTCYIPTVEDDVQEARYLMAMAAAKLLLSKEIQTFSPIVYTHNLVSEEMSVPFASWRNFDLSAVSNWATCGIILTIPGYEDSVGIAAEADTLTKQNKPVYTASLEEISELPMAY